MSARHFGPLTSPVLLPKCLHGVFSDCCSAVCVHLYMKACKCYIPCKLSVLQRESDTCWGYIVLFRKYQSIARSCITHAVLYLEQLVALQGTLLLIFAETLVP